MVNNSTNINKTKSPRNPNSLNIVCFPSTVKIAWSNHHKYDRLSSSTFIASTYLSQDTFRKTCHTHQGKYQRQLSSRIIAPPCTFVVKAMGRLCEVFLNKQNIVDASSNMVCNIYIKKFIAK
jgi:hypothetical protein